jgi:hypothetical protein
MAHCGICNKELLHPVCPLCLTDKIEPWIERKKLSLIKGYREQVRTILDKTRYSKISCTVCRSVNEKAICPFCFAGKIYGWLETKDEKLAGEFAKSFSAKTVSPPKLYA